MDVFRVRVPLHHPGADDVLKNKHMRTMVEKRSHRKWFIAVYAIENNSTFTCLRGFLLAWVSIRAGQYG